MPYRGVCATYALAFGLRADLFPSPKGRPIGSHRDGDLGERRQTGPEPEGGHLVAQVTPLFFFDASSERRGLPGFHTVAIITNL